MQVFGKLMRGAVIAGSLGVVAACNEAGSNLAPTAPDGAKALAPAGSVGSSSGAAQALSAKPFAAIATVTCSKQVAPRTPRSKISVDGKNLVPGRYRARVTSPPGQNAIVARAQPTIGDEVEFDFDSQAGPGVTPIPANYIQVVPGGPDVLGEILSSEGSVVASQAVDCQVR